MTCAVCEASRRRPVDAFFLGFRAGFRAAVVATIRGRGEILDIEEATLCLAHEKTRTDAQADEVRACMSLEELGAQGPYVCPGCYAVGGERCAPGCIDDAMAREREEAELSGDYDDRHDENGDPIAENELDMQDRFNGEEDDHA